MNRKSFLSTTALAALGLSLGGWRFPKKTHFLTLSFDDGFKKSFYRVAEIHEYYGLKACFNVIATGHFPTFNRDPKWMPREILGDFDDWNKLASRGHELMPHTWEHLNLTEVPVNLAKENIDKCLDYFEQNLDGYDPAYAVYNFAYNASTPELEQYCLKRVAAIRTGGWLFMNQRANPFPAPPQNLRLGAWGHGPDNCDDYLEEEIQAFLQTEGGWLVLNLHGLDGEGWGPVSPGYLDGLLKRMVQHAAVAVLPAGEMVKALQD
ncbi:MAG: polysaccharide deacetylase family protein [Bacteroidota bacterium]